MKRTFTLLLVTITLLGSTAFINQKSSGGIWGYSGSPNEQTCAGGGCHGGGSSASKGVTITATPSFSQNQYMADSVYNMTVTIGATGFSRFGLNCEVLDSTNANAGVMSNAGSASTFNSYIGRNVLRHTTPKLGANSAAPFTFKWTAPSQGKVTFYVCGNAVNLNGNTSGDIPIPYNMVLYPAPLPEDTSSDVGIAEEINKGVSRFTIFPNPSNGVCNLSYELVKGGHITADLLGIDGRNIKQLLNEKQVQGAHSKVFLLDNVEPGVYFLRLSLNGQKLSQKLLTVQ